jgi:hypothetical protein
LLDINNSWSKNAFWDVNNKKWRKWCKFVSPSLFNNNYGLPVVTMVTNVQINYFMFDWSIYRIFVLNTGWKRDSLQMKIFVNICSTWWMVQMKTRFLLWITRNDVSGVSLFHFSYLITLMAYLCSQWTPNVLIKYFIIDWCQIGPGNVTLSK